eukprot:5724211-Amphidinium_carterae.1
MSVGQDEHTGFREELLMEVRKLFVEFMGGDISLSEERSPGGYYKELWRRWLAVSKDLDVPVR